MILRPPRYTRPDTLFPNTTLFRSRLEADIVDRDHGGLVLALAGEGLAEVFGCDHGLDRGLGSGDWRLGCRADAARTWLNWTLGAGAFALPSPPPPAPTPRTPPAPPPCTSLTPAATAHAPGRPRPTPFRPALGRPTPPPLTVHTTR